ncbi:hypothetical protein [Aureimonas sp. AU4]|uniref:hypothetical protein n=1 Tax=Aureimonas sp. AU4 TaxID=1638163 RepID=UPI0007811E94|nr:hypothetical protein [Aureimonas sp. AU4]
MAETMTALVERHRTYLAALTAGCKTDWSREVEAAFYATADTEAGDIIENDPPRLQDHADLLAAIRYVADDVDFLQKGHARVLARAVEYLTTPAASVMSQRVSSLFGSIVALEAEQYAASDKNADALGARVLALHDELWALRDTHANADLLAARIMLGLMLRNCWQELDRVEWSIDDRFDLDTLSFLTDRLTGEVRRQAAFALGTIGVVIDGGGRTRPWIVGLNPPSP